MRVAGCAVCDLDARLAIAIWILRCAIAIWFAIWTRRSGGDSGQGWQGLDRPTRDRLFQRISRMVRRLPAAAAAEWAGAKTERSGVRKLYILKLYIQDPIFGSLSVTEEKVVEDSSSSSTCWRWESRDDLEIRFGFLPEAERLRKVDQEVAAATKKQKHPQKKGEFIYLFWRGCDQVDVSTGLSRRQLRLNALALVSNGMAG